MSTRLAWAKEPDAEQEKKRAEHGYWSVGDPRWFISTKSDVGAYLKPYFSAGYGLPHWLWVGMDVNAVLTWEIFQPYAGLRATSPILDLAYGFRDTWSFRRPFLTPAHQYSASDVQDAPGPGARYWAWELRGSAKVPLPYSGLGMELIMVKLIDVPRLHYVYDESYRAVIADRHYAVLRAGAAARLLREDSLMIGAMVEHVFETGRHKGVYRVGPVGSLKLTDHLEAQATITFAVSSPDALGLALGTYALAGVRYRWATGEPDPKWPWEGPIIF